MSRTEGESLGERVALDLGTEFGKEEDLTGGRQAKWSGVVRSTGSYQVGGGASGGTGRVGTTETDRKQRG